MARCDGLPAFRSNALFSSGSLPLFEEGGAAVPSMLYSRYPAVFATLQA